MDDASNVRRICPCETQVEEPGPHIEGCKHAVDSSPLIPEFKVRRDPRPMTDRQRLCLDFIIRQIQVNGTPPTLREIGAAMGIRSTNGVNDHLRALERKGWIEKDDMKSRSIRVLVGPDSKEEPPPTLEVTRSELLGIVKLAWLVNFQKRNDRTYDLRRAILRIYDQYPDVAAFLEGQ